jgi:hypothetical protein
MSRDMFDCFAHKILVMGRVTSNLEKIAGEAHQFFFGRWPGYLGGFTNAI